MPTPDYNAFYTASASAGAALIGLLFVSISIAPEQTVHATAPWERRAASSGAFTALANAFFVSLGALLPDVNLGGFVVTMSIFSLITSLGMIAELLPRWRAWRTATRRGVLLVLAIGVYAFECSRGVELLRNANDSGAMQAIALLVISVYGLGLVRAWELLGGQRYRIFGILTSRRKENLDISMGASDPPDSIHPEKAPRP